MAANQQGTVEHLRQRMLRRYGEDGLQHKHCKIKNRSRYHWRTHPVVIDDEKEQLTESSGEIRKHKLERTKTRPGGEHIH